MPRITADNQVTLSLEALAGAHFQAGDEVSILPDGRGRLIVERRSADRRSVSRSTPDRRALSRLGDGVYPRDYLTGLRVPAEARAATVVEPAPVAAPAEPAAA